MTKKPPKQPQHNVHPTEEVVEKVAILLIATLGAFALVLHDVVSP